MDDRSARKRTYSTVETEQAVIRYASKKWDMRTIYGHLISCGYKVTRQRIQQICKASSIKLPDKKLEPDIKDIEKGLQRMRGVDIYERDVRESITSQEIQD